MHAVPYGPPVMLFYATTSNNQIICLLRENGAIKWITEIDAIATSEESEWWQSTKERTGWTSPILAGDRLLIASSKGELKHFSPKDGALVDTLDIADDQYLPPIVVKGALYLLNNDADLTVLQ